MPVRTAPVSHHTQDPICPLCEEKLQGAHMGIKAWFRAKKIVHTDLHISCAWRNEVDQNEARLTGHSELAWPNSAHNRMEDGKPSSKALDLFQLDADGGAKWDPLYFAQINAENVRSGALILWGGQWKSLGDSCHFQEVV